MKLIIAVALVCSALTTEAALVTRTALNSRLNWTNIGGLLTPAGGQAATNRLQFISGAADNATNVAAVVDTATAWTPDSGAMLATFGTGGAPKANIRADGSVFLGSAPALEIGLNAAGFYPLYALSMVSSNEAPNVSFAFGAYGNADFTDYAAIYGNAGTDPSTPTATLGVAAYGLGTPTSRWTLSVATTNSAAYDAATFRHSGVVKFNLTSDGRIATQGGTAITPASANATGTAGTILWDASFIYICVAANTWKRVAIATW